MFYGNLLVMVCYSLGKKNRKSTRTTKWVSTAIPKTLAEEIRDAIGRGASYTGLTAFIEDACRRRLEQLEKPVAVPAQ